MDQGREIDPEDHVIHLQDLEAMNHRLDTELKDTSKALVAWKGGYQHLQGMWTHEEIEWEAAEWHIKEMQDKLIDLQEARRA